MKTGDTDSQAGEMTSSEEGFSTCLVYVMFRRMNQE